MRHAIHDLSSYGVACTRKLILNPLESFFVVVLQKVFNILQKKRLWFPLFKNCDDAEKQVAAILILESAFMACNGKRLARKTSEKNVKTLWNPLHAFFFDDFKNVGVINLAKIQTISFTGMLIEVIGVGGLETCRLESDAYSSDASE